MKYVYIVANAGVEHFSIEHICLSEKTARKRFEEVKDKIVEWHKRIYEMEMIDYYEEDKDPGLFKYHTESFIEAMSFFNSTTFENQQFWLHEHPRCIKSVVEE